MWDVFRVSSDKLGLCHLELMKKMNDLIRDINKYSEEQVKIHRKVNKGLLALSLITGFCTHNCGLLFCFSLSVHHSFWSPTVFHNERIGF